MRNEVLGRLWVPGKYSSCCEGEAMSWVSEFDDDDDDGDDDAAFVELSAGSECSLPCRLLLRKTKVTK